MIGYVTLGTNDIDKAAKFYDQILGEIGGTRFMELETFILWSVAADKPSIAVAKPYDGETASIGNGMMVGIVVESPQKVDELHAKALSLGATNEGDPGERGDGFYAAYFRDLDGNKLNFYNFTPSD